MWNLSTESGLERWDWKQKLYEKKQNHTITQQENRHPTSKEFPLIARPQCNINREIKQVYINLAQESITWKIKFIGLISTNKAWLLKLTIVATLLKKISKMLGLNFEVDYNMTSFFFFFLAPTQRAIMLTLWNKICKPCANMKDTLLQKLIFHIYNMLIQPLSI